MQIALRCANGKGLCMLWYIHLKPTAAPIWSYSHNSHPHTAIELKAANLRKRKSKALPVSQLYDHL
ncbi:hypothetical protein ACMYR2_1085 [Nitrobacter sp. TKz-YC01]